MALSKFRRPSVMGAGIPVTEDPGARATNTLRVASNVVDQTTVTVGKDVYEVHVLNTDTNVNVSGGDLNNTNLEATVTITAHGLTVGAYLRVENEHMVVTEVVDVDNVKVLRGYAGTTIATHADATDIFKAAQAPGAGRIPVTIGATLTPTVFTTQFVAVANAAGLEPISYVRVSANEVIATADKAGAVVTACTETLAGANNVWAAATMYGGRAASNHRRVSFQTRVPNATEVALENMHFLFDFAPTVLAVLVRVTATPGVAKAWDGAVTVTGNRVTLDNAGTTDWAATDTVFLIVSE